MTALNVWGQNGVKCEFLFWTSWEEDKFAVKMNPYKPSCYSWLNCGDESTENMSAILAIYKEYFDRQIYGFVLLKS